MARRLAIGPLEEQSQPRSSTVPFAYILPAIQDVQAAMAKRAPEVLFRNAGKGVAIPHVCHSPTSRSGFPFGLVAR